MHQFTIPSLLRWVGIPFAIALTASTVKSFIAGPGWIVAWLLAALCLVGWAIALLVAILLAALRRNWKRAILLPCLCVCALPLVVVGATAGDYVHLVVMYPSYAAEIRRHPNWQTEEVRFDWGDEAVWVPDGLRARTLIYDAGGKTMVGDRQGEDGLRMNVQHFIGNFYLEMNYTG